MSVPPRCVIDRSIMNANTIPLMTNIGLSIYAPLCGRNRGAFVLDPPDGNTYGCTNFPSNFAELAGVSLKEGVEIVDSNHLLWAYDRDGDISGEDLVDMIDLYVQSVYTSSADDDKTPFACDAGGLAMLTCDADDEEEEAERRLSSGNEPIRAVTLAGLFVPVLWATGGKELTLEESKNFYSASDFDEMKSLGVNTVRIQVPLHEFESEMKEVLTDLLEMINESGLKAILVLDDSDHEDHHLEDHHHEDHHHEDHHHEDHHHEDHHHDSDIDAVTNAATYATSISSDVILALALPSTSSTLVTTARAVSATLPLFLPVNPGNILDLKPHADDGNIYGAIDLQHSRNVGDVASSTSVDDRRKMFYHEATACISRSPIEYSKCYAKVPVFVSGGFDLSIDDCVHEGTAEFKDYGQCRRFDETVDSKWWRAHRMSFARRQVFAYERGLGWSFAAWKLYGDEEDAEVLDKPAKLLTLKNVAAAGLMPSLLEEEEPADVSLACLNNPIEDFELGDDTLAPTPSPPPDCGDGWWSYEKNACEYWVPPTPDCGNGWWVAEKNACEYWVPPTPDCGDGWWVEEKGGCEYWVPPTAAADDGGEDTEDVYPSPAPLLSKLEMAALGIGDGVGGVAGVSTGPFGTGHLGVAAVVGGVVALVVQGIVRKIRGGNGGGYTSLPP